MRIFLSYGHDEHVELAIRIKADLEARGHEVWFDQDRIMPGGDYECYIEEGLNWCAAFPENGGMVLLMTPHSVRRPDGYCLNEIAAAINRKMAIIPVMVVECEPPLSILRIQWLDMTDCVPVSERAERYQLKLDQLIRAVERSEIDFEGSHAYLHRHLKPLDFSADLARHVAKFTGRKWVFDRIDAWLASPIESKVFWITGPPGVGKTAIAAYLCYKRREVAGFHLCQHGHEDKSDPGRCVMSLAYQLSSQMPDYQKRLAAMDLGGEVAKSPTTLFDNLIVQPLAPPFPAPDRPILIVIDALDEAAGNGRNELAEFIAKEFPRTPPWLRLVITSRADTEVVQPLQGSPPNYLDASSPDNLQDIRTYLRDHLPLSSPQQTIDEEVINTLLEKSEGIFLYVERVLADLREQKLTLDRVHELPPGLGASFFQFFARQFPDITSYQQRHRPLLEMIIAARGPLPLRLAQAALRWSPYDYQVNEQGEASGAALTPLGSLFPYERGNIRPFHQSIIDWLTNPSNAGSYFVNSNQGHERLANVCWDEYQVELKKMSSYALSHLPTHLLEMERWEDLLELVSDLRLGLINKWIEKGEGDKGLRCMTALINYLKGGNQKPLKSAGLATQVARIYSIQGDYEHARAWLYYALKLSSWRKGRRARAVALHELGSLYLYQGDICKASRLYKRALRLCLWGIPVYHDEAAANLIGLATVFRTMYRLSKTISFAKRAMRQAEIAKDSSHIIAGERLLAFAYKTLGKYPEAEQRLKNANSMCEQYGEPIEKIRLKLLRGWFEYDLAKLKGGLPHKASAFFLEALADAHSAHNFFCIIEAKIGLGKCALKRGATAEAKKWFEPLKEALPKGKHPDLLSSIKAGIAAVLHQRGELEIAGNLYNEVINFCAQNNMPGIEARIGLGAIQWHLGRCEAAIATWQKALQLSENISQATRFLTESRIKSCQADPRATP